VAPPPCAAPATPTFAAPARAKRSPAAPESASYPWKSASATARQTSAGGPATSTPGGDVRAFREARRAAAARGASLDDNGGAGARATSSAAPETASYTWRSAPLTARRTPDVSTPRGRARSFRLARRAAAARGARLKDDGGAGAPATSPPGKASVYVTLVIHFRPHGIHA
jgi:hypothetical protein